MNKRLFSVGVVTIGLLLLGSLSIPVAAQDEGGINMDTFEGVLDLISDISLTNNWIYRPAPGPLQTDLTNTNLRYNITSMKSPLDQWINVGFFFGGDPNSGPVPEFAIDGTFVGSELFVKIVNDQESIYDPTSRLLDWQAVLTLGRDINISMNLPPELADQGVPVDLLPSSVVLPAGAGTPPLPVVSSTTSFSGFEDLSDMASFYGYDGLPFVAPSIFYVEDVTDAFNYWNDSANHDNMFPPAESPENNNSVTVTPTLTPDFNLSIEASFFNQTDDHGSISIMAIWDQTSGWLTHFEIGLFADLDQSGTLDASEEFSFVFEMLSETKALLPLNIGDQGEYILDIDLSATVALEDAAENQTANDILGQIIDSIEELDQKQLLNFTVDAMDGLYYHLNGYMLDINRFLGDRIGLLFSNSTEPLPLLQDYYHPFDDNMDQRGTHDFAINLFDAQMYQNSTAFYQVYDGNSWGYYDEYGYWQSGWDPLQAEDNKTLPIHEWIKGIVHAQVYEKNDWNMNYDPSKTFAENLATTSAVEIYYGPVDYYEKDQMYWNGTHDVPTGDTYTAIQINDSINENFTIGVEYLAVFEIQALPDSGFTSYFSKDNFMMMFFGGGNEGMDAGMGAQVEPPMNEQSGPMIPVDPQMAIPMPVRTPDWNQVGGAIILVEAYVDQLADVITNPDFIAFLTNQPMEDPGDSVAIHTFNFDLDWINNATYVGADAYTELDMTQVDNDTMNLDMVTTNGYIYTEEHYHWALNGAFDTMSSYSEFHLDVDRVDYTPGDTTTTVPPETTTTESTAELSPGFETIFALGSLIALPIFLRKRR